MEGHTLALSVGQHSTDLKCCSTVHFKHFEPSTSNVVDSQLCDPSKCWIVGSKVLYRALLAFASELTRAAGYQHVCAVHVWHLLGPHLDSLSMYVPGMSSV
jgi:hypothetical protein